MEDINLSYSMPMILLDNKNHLVEEVKLSYLILKDNTFKIVRHQLNSLMDNMIVNMHFQVKWKIHHTLCGFQQEKVLEPGYKLILSQIY